MVVQAQKLRVFAAALAWACLSSFTPPALCAAAAPAAAVRAEGTVSLGFLAPAGAPAEAPARPSAALGSGPWVRFVARWSEIESQPGIYDWSALQRAVAPLRAAGERAVLCLTGLNPLHPAPDGMSVPLDPWLAFARSAVRDLGGLVEVIEVWDRPSSEPAFDPDFYAFLLKATTLAVRAEARAGGVSVLLAQGAVAPARLDWQQRLWEAGTAAYVDIVPLDLAPAELDALESSVRSAYAEIVQHPPASRLWAYVSEPEPWSAAKGAVRALAAGAEVALATAAVTAGDSAEPPTGVTAWVRGVDRLLSGGYAPAPFGTLAFVERSGAALREARVLGRFVNVDDFNTLVVYEFTGAAGAPPAEALLALDVPDAREVRVVDPLSGLVRAGASGALPDGSGRRAIGVAFREYPMVVRFKRAAERVQVAEENLQIGGERGLTADEIIARNQEVQRVQDDQLERWTAKGRIEFHFKLAQAGSTVDVGIDCNYFWRRGAPLEWEQTDFYINGNRVNWKDFPEIPFVQPERVATLPLDLTLDRSYLYRLVGEDEVDGRRAYVLAFEPADPNAPLALYRGRVWIDRLSFVKLKASLVQTQLDPPVLSNEEVDTYTPVPASAGAESPWLLTRAEGQQLWTVAARNLVVSRTLNLSDFEVNVPAEEFERRLSAAYASKNQMLRDTPDGFKYLQLQPDGTRVEKAAKTSQWFAAAGAFKDSSLKSVVPLAGVNWLDFNLGDRDIQANVFFAGALLFGNVTWPNLFHQRIDGAAETALTALKGTDKFYVGDIEQESERVESRDQYVSARLGFPWGQFFKATLSGSVTFANVSAADETAPSFRLPVNHRVLTSTAQLEWNRRNTSVNVGFSASTRSDWQPWGFPDGSGAYPSYDPAHKNYTQARATVFHEWYLPKFQKLRLEGSYLTGSDLDRFSKFQFGFFGQDRLSGYAGSGVRFERGAIARGGYAFNLFELLRFDFTVESARVREDAGASSARSFSGVGLGANFVAPWKTIVNVSYGRAVVSDIPELEGQQEFLLTIFKLF